MTGQPSALNRVLSAAQRGIPIVSRPYEAIGRECGLAEAEVLRLLEQAYADGLVRETSAIFDATAIGYESTLVAVRVPAEQRDSAAQAISAHPGVSHNYAREHEYSLWFTLATPPGRDIEEEARDLVARSGQWKYHTFPTLKRYKIGVSFDLEEDSASPDAAPQAEAVPQPILPDDIRAIRVLQNDLPRTSRPFEVLASRAGMVEEELLAACARFKATGALRRLACVLRHRAAGYRSNVMSVWDVSADSLDKAGETLAAYRSVSHCYRRPSYADWPYELFAMIHARTDEMIERVIEEAAAAISPRKFELLESVHEYKKERVRFFEP